MLYIAEKYDHCKVCEFNTLEFNTLELRTPVVTSVCYLLCLIFLLHDSKQDIQTWDAMQEALSYSDINDADWLDMAASAGVADVTAIDAAQFEAVVDALVERLGFCDEEGCDIEDNDHDNEHE